MSAGWHTYAAKVCSRDARGILDEIAVLTRLAHYNIIKGTLLGTPNREPQEYSRNMMEYKDPGRYIPIIYLLYSWGSRFGVPSRVPLIMSVYGSAMSSSL